MLLLPMLASTGSRLLLDLVGGVKMWGRGLGVACPAVPVIICPSQCHSNLPAENFSFLQVTTTVNILLDSMTGLEWRRENGAPELNEVTGHRVGSTSRVKCASVL